MLIPALGCELDSGGRFLLVARPSGIAVYLMDGPVQTIVLLLIYPVVWLTVGAPL